MTTMQDMQPAEQRQAVDKLLALVTPTLLGLRALAPGTLSEEVREPATDIRSTMPSGATASSALFAGHGCTRSIEKP